MKQLLSNLILISLFGLPIYSYAEIANNTSAVEFFLKNEQLANEGNIFSQYNLGLMYSNGKGVRQDYTKALEWYQKAANQGYAKAQYNLGLMYSDGKGVRQDYTKAFEWYQKAADQGNGIGKFNLGTLYYNGNGVRRNTLKAKELLGQACDAGLQQGCDEYRKLN